MQAYQAFAACYDALMYDVDYPAWARYIAGLIERHGAPDKTLLDAACGTLVFYRFGLEGQPQ